MRLEPVYLVAPRPTPQTMTSRRAFLLAGCTFATGVSLGGACGYAAGVGRGDGGGATGDTVDAVGDGTPAKAVDGAVTWEPSGDAILEELRRLAVKAPIEELVARRLDFCQLLYSQYPNDEIAWRGIGRLAEEVLRNDAFENRRTFSRWIATFLEKGTVDAVTPYRPLISELRRIR